MSTWTSKIQRLGLVALAPIALSACLSPEAGGTGTGFAGFLAQPNEKTVAPQRRLTLFDGAVVVAGPQGFCIDPRSTRRRSGGQFVVLANCASLSGAPDMSGPSAVITVSVLPHDASATRPTAQDIAASMAPAKVIKRITTDTLSLVHLSSGGNDALSGSDPRHWRGATVINGHLIGMAAYGAPGSKVAASGGRTLLTKLSAIMHGASAEQAPTAPASASASQPVAKPKPKNPFAQLLSAITKE